MYQSNCFNCSSSEKKTVLTEPVPQEGRVLSKNQTNDPSLRKGNEEVVPVTLRPSPHPLSKSFPVNDRSVKSLPTHQIEIVETVKVHLDLFVPVSVYVLLHHQADHVLDVPDRDAEVELVHDVVEVDGKPPKEREHVSKHALVQKTEGCLAGVIVPLNPVPSQLPDQNGLGVVIRQGVKFVDVVYVEVPPGHETSDGVHLAVVERLDRCTQNGQFLQFLPSNGSRDDPVQMMEPVYGVGSHVTVSQGQFLQFTRSLKQNLDKIPKLCVGGVVSAGPVVVEVAEKGRRGFKTVDRERCQCEREIGGEWRWSVIFRHKEVQLAHLGPHQKNCRLTNSLADAGQLKKHPKIFGANRQKNHLQQFEG
jgi:hypothetical protein